MRGPRGILIELIELDGRVLRKVTQYGTLIGDYATTAEAMTAIEARGIDPADLESVDE